MKWVASSLSMNMNLIWILKNCKINSKVSSALIETKGFSLNKFNLISNFCLNEILCGTHGSIYLLLEIQSATYYIHSICTKIEIDFT